MTEPTREAVEAAARAQHALEDEGAMGHSWDGCEFQDSYRDVALVMLTAALPPIRARIANELRVQAEHEAPNAADALRFAADAIATDKPQLAARRRDSRP